MTTQEVIQKISSCKIGVSLTLKLEKCKYPQITGEFAGWSRKKEVFIIETPLPRPELLRTFVGVGAVKGIL